MKKSILAILLVASGIAFTSCRNDKKPDTVVKEKTVIEKEKPAKEQEGILERAGEKIDNKVNNEVDKKIDEIGDEE